MEAGPKVSGSSSGSAAYIQGNFGHIASFSGLHFFIREMTGWPSDAKSFIPEGPSFIL